MAEHSGPNSRSALVLFGSETGNAQEIAGELGRLAERLQFATHVTEFDNIGVKDLRNHVCILFAVSTTGQGDLPGNARSFWKRLRSTRLQPGCLRGVCFASFGLGDSSYPKFNWAHRKIYNRFLQLGAEIICDRGEADEQHPEGLDGLFVPWSAVLRQALIDRFPLPAGLDFIPDHVFLEPKWYIELLADDSTQSSPNLNHLTTVSENSLDQAAFNQSLPGFGNVCQALFRVNTRAASSTTIGDFTATLEGNKRLTPTSHWQDVRQLDFRTPPYEYMPGDVLTIFPMNSIDDTDEFLSLNGWADLADYPIVFKPSFDLSKETTMPLPPIAATESRITLKNLIMNHLDISAIPRRSFFASIAHFTTDDTQKERLIEFTNPEFVDELYDYTTRPRRSIIEVLQEFDTVKLPLKWLASLIPTIRGRQFSIASGGDLKRYPNGDGRIQLLVAIVRYRTVIKKIREGLCTKYLASLETGSKLHVMLCKGGMHTDIDQPAMMVGPGTGLAPLRSMIYERAAKRGNAPLVLFFGGRSRSADYFFEDDWVSMQSLLPLTVVTAFSRDQTNKVYVQDVIRQEARLVYNILKTGAVYICGSSGKMPQAVRESLIDVFEVEGNLGRLVAEQTLVEMEKSGRYQQETW